MTYHSGRRGFTLASICMSLFATMAWAAEPVQSVPSTQVPAGLIELGTGQFYSPYAFVVDKKHRQLMVWEQQGTQLKEVTAYPIDLGRGGGVKEKRGDDNTPEGIYFLMRMLDGPSLDFKEYGARAFTTNYPNLFDTREGKTGSGIWLHAVPDTTPLSRGSSGCVVVRNNVIKALTKYVKLERTPILIFGQVPFTSAQSIHQTDNAIKAEIESWRTAWENKDINKYMTYYSPSFHSLHMDWKHWKKYKESLNESYQTIRVRLSEPVIYRHDDEVVARFLQAYQSDKKIDYGEKELYLRQENGAWKIIAEQWNEVSNPLAYQDLPPLTRSLSCTGGNCSADQPSAAVQKATSAKN